MSRISVIGGGAWGTALAQAARRAGHDVRLQAREPEVVAAINTRHENTVFLPGITLDPAIRATADPAEAADAEIVLLVAPAQHLRKVCESLRPHWRSGAPAVICAKGIELGSGAMMTEVASAVLGEAAPVAVLSGPSFASEVARDLPTAVTLAAENESLAKHLAASLASRRLRIYSSTDCIGAEIGGAVKNVLAIGCGVVEGRKLGDNARAALITRGLAEMVRLGLAKGGRAETLMGLSGIGDLTLTCNALQSRNFSLGVALGRGRPLTEILAERQSVAEGVSTAGAVVELAKRLGVDMPICAAMDGILNRHADIDKVIDALMSRPLKDESPTA